MNEYILMETALKNSALLRTIVINEKLNGFEDSHNSSPINPMNET
jgi:hypothetical protein